MHEFATAKGTKDTGRSADRRFSRLAAAARICRKFLRASILLVGAMAVAFALAAFLYNRFVHYDSVLVGWPPPAEFIAPVEWNPDDPGRVRILAIDGGGVDGVIMLEILKYLEEQSGRPVSELFDFVAGTSTGAIITVGMLLADDEGNPRYSADDMVAIYARLAQRVLNAPLYHRILTLNGLLGPRLRNHARFVATHDIFADVRFGDLRRPAMVPVFSREESGLETFRNWTRPDANLFVGPLLAAATSAPTYFPAVLLKGHDGSEGLYTDAGLIVDNPAHLAFLHALERYPDGDFVVVSLGMRHISDISLQGGVGGGALDWLGPIISMVANGQKDLSTSALETIESIETSYDLEVFRLAPEISWDGSQFDGSSENIERLKRMAEDYVADHHGELDEVLEALHGTAAGAGDRRGGPRPTSHPCDSC